MIKKRNEEGATKWALHIAEHLKKAHNIESYIEPAAAADLPTLPTVTSLNPADNIDDVPAFDSSGSLDDSFEKCALSFLTNFFFDELYFCTCDYLNRPSSAASTSTEPSSWQSQIDLAIAIGGDGTLLYLSSLFPKSCPPIVPFFCGSLGFLMSFDLHSFDEVLNVCIKGRQPILNRHRLEFCVTSEDEWFRNHGSSPETR